MNCQKCRTPLKLDSSLQELNPAAFDLLVGPSIPLDPRIKPKSFQPPQDSPSTMTQNPPDYPILKNERTSTISYPKMPPLLHSSGSSPRLGMASASSLPWQPLPKPD